MYILISLKLHSDTIYYILEVLNWTIHEEEKKKYKEYSVRPNSRDYKSVQNGQRPDYSYVREAGELEREKRQARRALPPRSKQIPHNQSETNSSSENNTSMEGKCIS